MILKTDVFYTFGRTRTELFGPDMEDDYVIVQHSMDFSVEQKQEIAEYVKEVLTVKKTVYKTERPKILIVFEKKESENFFIF